MARKKNTTSLTEIEQQIAELQRKRDEIQSTEKVGVIARIKVAIAHYGLTADDLGLTGNARRGGRSGVAKAEATSRGRGRVKFRDDAGNAWSGFGRKPKWFLDALAAGATVESLNAG